MRRSTFWLAAALLVLASASGARAQDDGRVTVDEFKQLLARNGAVVLDVRNEEIGRKIKGALHLPYNDIERRAGELPRDREIITYCA
ncbi:MAG TPA: rhodanese-like domain-containing protein [Pyrinomonadaceae bacterium]